MAKRSPEEPKYCEVETATKEVPTRYLLVPCRGTGENYPEHIYAVSDQAAGGVITRWVNEQEVEILVVGNELASWDQSYSVEPEETLLCPDCQSKETKPKKIRRRSR